MVTSLFKTFLTFSFVKGTLPCSETCELVINGQVPFVMGRDVFEAENLDHCIWAFFFSFSNWVFLWKRMHANCLHIANNFD